LQSLILERISFILRFGVCFAAVICWDHFVTLIASDFHPVKRILALFAICDGATIYRTFLGPRIIHWGACEGDVIRTVSSWV
jgi:hypothetical protein